MIQYAEMKKPDLIQLFLDHGFKMENMTNDAAKEYVNSISNCKALDWDRLKELSKGRKGKFEYDFWFDDVTKITPNEGNVSLLQAYIDNQKKAVVEPEAIRMICDAGVNVNHKDREDCSALFIAAMRTQDIEVYKALIECGIDVTYIPKKGPKCDIISVFVEYAKYKNEKLFKLMIDNGLTEDKIVINSAKEYVKSLLSQADNFDYLFGLLDFL